MSYVISIRSHSGAPLNRIVADQALASDNEFRPVGHNAWEWQPQGRRTALVLNWEEEGTLSTGGDRAWTSAEGLAKLRSIAAWLDASLIGEDGEDLTTDEPSEPTASIITAFQSIVSLLMLPFVLASGLLMIVVRLPRIFWKIWRTTRGK